MDTTSTAARLRIGIVAALSLSCLSTLGALAWSTSRNVEAEGSMRKTTASSAETGAFSAALNRFSSFDYDPPESVAYIVSRASIVLAGEIVGATQGRKEYIGKVCADIDPADERNPCRGERKIASYASYVNMIIRPTTILKGKLEASSSSVQVEFPWPNNVAVEGFSQSIPKGSRVIVAGRLVQTARDSARKLQMEGGPTSVVASNLMAVPPYGLILEGGNGATVLPVSHHDEFAEVIKQDKENVRSFDAALLTFRRATGR